MDYLKRIWNYLEHNRFTVVFPMIAGFVWLVAIGCTPLTPSPLEPEKMVDAKELSIDYEKWLSDQRITEKRFEAAGEDIAEQVEANEKFSQFLLTLASGSVADWGGLVQLILTGGFLDVGCDNIRKNGVIGGLKRNR